MNEPLHDIVRRAVALYLDVDPSTVRPGHRFERDLGLYPLDIALIMLDIEEAHRIELPIDRLDAIETVAELTTLVRRVIMNEDQDTEERLLAERLLADRHRRRQSGTHRRDGGVLEGARARTPPSRAGGQGR